MAQPMYPVAPAAKSRPSTVTIAAYLLYAVAALSVLGSLLGLATLGTTSEAYKSALDGTGAEQDVGTLVVVVSVAAVVVNILLATGLVVLGIFDARGRQGARVTTWVLGGVMLCCSGLGLAGGPVGRAMQADTNTGVNGQEVQEQLKSSLPGWYSPVTDTLSVLMLLALLVSLILLALPPSNAYFQAVRAMRLGVAGWDPSMPYQAYPGYPTYPGYPVQPGYQQPGYQQPGFQQPGFQQPGFQQPGFQQPGFQQPGPMAPPPVGSPPDPHTTSMPATDPWERPTDPDPTRHDPNA